LLPYRLRRLDVVSPRLRASGPVGEQMINVIILSDVGLYREGLASILKDGPGIRVSGTASSAAEALDVLERTPEPVALLDLATPHALEIARSLSRGCRSLRLLALGIDDERQRVLECAEAGITGFVGRGATTADLVESIRCVAAGELRCSRDIAGALIQRLAAVAGSVVRPAPLPSLTPRELQIARLVDEGLTNKEIASRLMISPATARNHVHSILEKLGARTRTAAAAVMRRSLFAVQP
jgi:DNA-binding NarL/FixJ family response regulator